MFSHQPQNFSVRTRTRAAALAAAEEGSKAPDSTLGTAEPKGESRAPTRAGAAVTSTKKPTYRSVVIAESRKGSPEPAPPAAEAEISFESLGINPSNTADSESQWPENAQRPYPFASATPSAVEPPPAEQPWTDVRRSSRSRSHDSATRVRPPLNAGQVTPPNRSPRRNSFGGLLPALLIDPAAPKDIPPHFAAILQAEKDLTPEQRQRIWQRFLKAKMAPARSPSPDESQEEGPSSRAKGKTVDPRNWGNITLDNNELNARTQAELLERYNKSGRDTCGHKHNKDGHTRGREPQPRQRSASGPARDPTPRMMETRPINQIPENSYLGRTLSNMDRLRTLNLLSPEDDPSSSDSSSSSSDDESDPRSPRIRHGPKIPKHPKKRRSHRRSKSRKSTLKPIPPKEYDGSPDSRLYNRFVTEGTAYVIDGKVAANRHAFVLSYYMTGIAYDFYTQKVSSNFEDWRLPEFFDALFNYCFPINFRMEQRNKLKRSFQNDRSVAAYVHELEELFNLIGMIDERDKVIKLWDGLRVSIKQSLWRDHYNPEISSWEEVVNQAETIEIAESLTSAKNHRASNNDPKPRTGSSSSGNHGSRSSHDNNHRPRNGNRNSPHPFRTFNHARNIRPRPPFNPSRGTSGVPHSTGMPSRANTPHTNRSFNKPRPQLSDKERSELLAAGKCFVCKETGHMSRSCPKNSTVRSSSSRPPGLSNFNIEIGNEDDSEEVEYLDSIPLGMISYEAPDARWRYVMSYPFQQWEKEYNPTAKRRKCLGDAVALGAQNALEIEAPYPGDAPYQFVHPTKQGKRFQVIQSEDEEDIYYVFDLDYQRCEAIQGCYLRHPHFRIGAWYADISSRWTGSQIYFRTHSITMGDVYGYNAALVLRSGIKELYPTQRLDIDDESRFDVVLNGLMRWDIYDIDREGPPLRVSFTDLSNPKFDLARWYQKHRFEKSQIYYYLAGMPAPRMGYAPMDLPPSSPISTEEPCSGCSSEDYDVGAESCPECAVSTDDDSDASVEAIYCGSVLVNGISGEHLEAPTSPNVPALGTRLPPHIDPLRSRAAENFTRTINVRVVDEPELVFPDRDQFSSDDEYQWHLGVEGRRLRPYTRLGDIIGTQLLRALESGTPYPGDQDQGFEEGDRFVIEAATPQVHLVRDLQRNVTTYFDHELTTHPDFQPAREYAYRCAVYNNVFVGEHWATGLHEKMGPLIERQLERAIENSRPFLHDQHYQPHLRKRCEVHWNPEDLDQILIEDLFCKRIWYLPRYLIENVNFNIAEWYQTRLLYQHTSFEDDEFYFARSSGPDDSLDIAMEIEVQRTLGPDVQEELPVFQLARQTTRPPDHL